MGRTSFDDVLGTNYVPGHIETCSIKATIESLVQELSSLNYILTPLLAKRKKLISSIRSHRALLAPVRRVPSEIISEIFIRTIHNSIIPNRLRWGESEHEDFPRPSVDVEPLKLGRICRIWRDISLSTPSLWSAISIPTAWNIEALREWISRSGSCTLSFTIYLCSSNSDHLNLLASYQNRWRDVVFLFDRLGAESQFLGYPRYFLRSLASSYECLHILKFGEPIRDRRVLGMPAKNDIRVVFDSAPKLRNLLLSAPIFNITTLNKARPLCLRELNITYAIPTAAFMSLLLQSPQVESILVHISFCDDADESNYGMLTLPSLKSLEIVRNFFDDPYFCPLESLHLPALEKLCIDMSESFHTSLPQMRSMIHRSRPPLKVLRVCGAHAILSADIMDCIPFVPSLSYLHLERVDGGVSGIIELLTGQIPPSDDMLTDCMCPQLDQLYLGYCEQEIAPESVVRLILSRSVAGRSRLCRVTVLQCTGKAVLADPRIAECIANGLKFGCKEDEESSSEYSE